MGRGTVKLATWSGSEKRMGFNPSGEKGYTFQPPSSFLNVQIGMISLKANRDENMRSFESSGE